MGKKHGFQNRHAGISKKLYNVNVFYRGHRYKLLVKDLKRHPVDDIVASHVWDVVPGDQPGTWKSAAIGTILWKYIAGMSEVRPGERHVVTPFGRCYIFEWHKDKKAVWAYAPSDANGFFLKAGLNQKKDGGDGGLRTRFFTLKASVDQWPSVDYGWRVGIGSLFEHVTPNTYISGVSLGDREEEEAFLTPDFEDAPAEEVAPAVGKGDVKGKKGDGKGGPPPEKGDGKGGPPPGVEAAKGDDKGW